MRRNNQELSLDLTPLIDVVFLLLIFFMLSASFDEIHWLDLQLPSVDEKEQAHQENRDPFIIGIDPNGQFHMHEKNLGEQTSAELKAYLSTHLMKDSIVVIHGDANAPHGKLVELLSVLGELQITQIQIATTNVSQ